MQLVQDRKEIVEFLKKSLEQRQDEIADLNDRLLGLQQVSCKVSILLLIL